MLKPANYAAGDILAFDRALMHYVNCYTFFEEPEKDWLAILESNESPPPEPMLFD